MALLPSAFAKEETLGIDADALQFHLDHVEHVYAADVTEN